MSGKKSNRSGRTMSEEEARLWSEVTGSVRPVEDRRGGAREVKNPPAEYRQPIRRVAEGSGGHGLERVRREPSQLGVIDRRTARQIGAGRIGIDAVLDLHGMRQVEAHTALARFLARCQSSGFRFVKVITGKGTSRADDGEDLVSGREERGVLRRVVPLWLEEAALRDFVVATRSAGRGHGGDGALYIQLRRPARSPGE